MTTLALSIFGGIGFILSLVLSMMLGKSSEKNKRAQKTLKDHAKARKTEGDVRHDYEGINATEAVNRHNRLS